MRWRLEHYFHSIDIDSDREVPKSEEEEGEKPKRMKCNTGGSKKEEKEMTRKYKGKNRI